MTNLYRLFNPVVYSTLEDGRDTFDCRQKIRFAGARQPFSLFPTKKPVHERISRKFSPIYLLAEASEEVRKSVLKGGWLSSSSRSKLKNKDASLSSKGLDEEQPYNLLCNSKTLTPKYEKISRRVSNYEKINSEMILFRDYFSLKDQVDILNICDNYMDPRGLYQPRYKNGVKYRMRMTCFGRNWDPQTGYNKSDGSEPPPVPYELALLAKIAVQDAQAYLDELPSMSPDICRLNFYLTSYGRLGPRQDCDESSDSISKGLPMVYFSIGQMTHFVYGDTNDKKKLKDIYLLSGDVLIFGGRSRLIYHGINYVYSQSCQSIFWETGLRSGHLSLTFRQF